MATKQVELPEVGAITLYKRRGNRSLRLSLAANGEVRVTMPYWLPYAAGERFALSKLQWIMEHKAQNPVGSLRHGQPIGKAHHLQFIASPVAAKVSTRLQQTHIEIHHPVTYPTHHPAVQEAAQKASLRALRKEAEMLLPQRLEQLATACGFTYKNVGVKQLKSRWGSCSSKQEITLSLFLMQLPWHLIDYVLMHELTHTKVMRHGAPFWKEFERHVPNAKRLRKEMAKYSPVLG